MARQRSIMSEALKMEIAKDLGFADTVTREGDFGSVPSRQCGNMVKRAIEMAEGSIAGK